MWNVGAKISRVAVAVAKIFSSDEGTGEETDVLFVQKNVSK